MKKLFFLLFLIILLSTNALAIGIRGPTLKDTLIFEPGLSKEYQFQLVTHAFTQDYEIYVKSQKGNENLTKYITVDTSIIKDVPAGSVYGFTAKLQLPQDIDTPGWHELRVGVRETQTRGGNVGAKASSEARIILLVLFPYKYLEAKIGASNTNINESSTITINIDNFGKIKVDTIYADLNIYDKDNQLVKALKTETISLESKQHGQLITTYNAEMVGYYTVNATLKYDGKTINKSTTFRSGDLDINIKSYKNKFYTDTINKMVVEVESGWNDLIKDIFTITTIYNGTTELTNGRSPSYALKGFKKINIDSFLDFSNIPIGNYTAKIEINFNGNIKSKSGIVEVIIPTEPFVEKPGKIITLLTENALLFSVLFFNILLMIVVLLLIFKKKKKNET